jgi:ATP-dependent HslUV protease subunit HslV
MLLVADREHILLLTGGGDVLEPDEPAMAIGSGGDYARAAALALSLHTNLKAAEIAKVALEIAGKICVYTNDTLTIEVLEG